MNKKNEVQEVQKGSEAWKYLTNNGTEKMLESAAILDNGKKIGTVKYILIE